jgi:DNA repair protein RecO (recombination protein O)
MSHRERLYQTEAIVLRRTNFGEADRLLTVFTPERGKMRLVAKGARKPTSRKSGHVELFSYGRYLVAVGRDLDIITQAETLEPFLPLHEDLLRATYAYYVADLTDAFTPDQDENQPLFILLKEALGWLSATGDLALAARYYEIHLLSLVGYQPQLFVCGACKKPLEPETNYFSPAQGTVFCRQCGYERQDAAELSTNALKVLRFLQTRDWDTCRLLRLSPDTHAEIERLMHRYISHHLERKLKSVDLIEHLRRQTEAR